jgi:hypothetical protein
MWRKYQRDSALTESAVRQEVVYNIARGFHQLQLLHLAELYYRQALALWDDEIRGTTADKRCVHITYEAAHNLVLVRCHVLSQNRHHTERCRSMSFR